MENFTRHFFVRLIILGSLLSGCISQPAPVATATQLQPTITRVPVSPVPTVTQLPTPTPQPSATETQTPTPIIRLATPVPTSTPVPTLNSNAPLSDKGPWLVYKDKNSARQDLLMAANLDRSGRRQLLSTGVGIISASAASPYLAVLVRPDDQIYPWSYRLQIIHFPELSVKTISVMPSFETNPADRIIGVEITLNPTQAEAYHKMLREGQSIDRAINYRKPTWSPNGRYLAFVAAIDGPTTDLYVYDTLLDQIRRLSDGPQMATWPEWSPDGRWIVHRAVDGFGIGCFEEGVWAAALDGSEVKWLTPGECADIVRWTGPETFETYVKEWPGVYSGPERLVNIAAGNSIILAPDRPEKKNPQANAPIYDCMSRKKLETPEIQSNGMRFDSPDGKWFVIAQDDLRLFRSDGSFVTEFSGFKQFSGWQPDSSAMIFVTRLESSSPEVLNYFQPGDQSLQTFSRSMFDDHTFVWVRGPSLEGNLEGMRCYQNRKKLP